MTLSTSPERTAERMRTIISGLRAVDEAIAPSPYEPETVADLLRGIRTAIEEILPVPPSAKEDRTNISRAGMRILLDRYRPELAAHLVRMGTAAQEDWPGIERTLRRTLISLAVTVDSLLATSTFRKGPAYEVR